MRLRTEAENSRISAYSASLMIRPLETAPG